MNYTLIPSLEHRALIKVAITLWNQDDIRALTATFDLIAIPRRREWQEIEDKVIKNVRALPLPESLKKKVSNFIKPIGLEILKWIKRHERVLFERSNTRLNSESLSKLCWTLQGTVDKKKTAEVLIRDENLDITKRYSLACTCCLENEILRLWNNVPEINRKVLYNCVNQGNANLVGLPFFWAYHAMGGMTDLCSGINPISFPYQFYNAVKNGNRVATEYFLQKIAPEHREKFLVICAEYACQCYSFPDSTSVYTEILSFLLSQMNEEQQLKVLKKSSHSVLRFLLEWPLQSFFIETAKLAWTFLDEDNFNFLVREITNKIMHGFKDYNYQKLFREFWQQSPTTHKEYVIQKCTSSSLLLNLLGIKDEENIKLVLETATTPDREKIIFSASGISACESFIYAGEMDLLKFFVQECISSREVMIKFREGFEEHIIKCRSKEKLEEEKDMWSVAFQLLDDLIKKCNKRKSVEEGNSDPAKRLCSSTNE